jgi:hypothetical protein
MRPNPRFCVVPAPPHGAGAVGGAVALATGAATAPSHFNHTHAKPAFNTKKSILGST